jgi:hypothetical protein
MISLEFLNEFTEVDREKFEKESPTDHRVIFSRLIRKIVKIITSEKNYFFSNTQNFKKESSKKDSFGLGSSIIWPCDGETFKKWINQTKQECTFNKDDVKAAKEMENEDKKIKIKKKAFLKDSKRKGMLMFLLWRKIFGGNDYLVCEEYRSIEKNTSKMIECFLNQKLEKKKEGVLEDLKIFLENEIKDEFLFLENLDKYEKYDENYEEHPCEILLKNIHKKFKYLESIIIKSDEEGNISPNELLEKCKVDDLSCIGKIFFEEYLGQLKIFLNKKKLEDKKTLPWIVKYCTGEDFNDRYFKKAQRLVCKKIGFLLIEEIFNRIQRKPKNFEKLSENAFELLDQIVSEIKEGKHLDFYEEVVGKYLQLARFVNKENCESKKIVCKKNSESEKAVCNEDNESGLINRICEKVLEISKIKIDEKKLADPLEEQKKSFIRFLRMKEIEFSKTSDLLFTIKNPKDFSNLTERYFRKPEVGNNVDKINVESLLKVFERYIKESINFLNGSELWSFSFNFLKCKNFKKKKLLFEIVINNLASNLEKLKKRKNWEMKKEGFKESLEYFKEALDPKKGLCKEVNLGKELNEKSALLEKEFGIRKKESLKNIQKDSSEKTKELPVGNVIKKKKEVEKENSTEEEEIKQEVVEEESKNNDEKGKIEEDTGNIPQVSSEKTGKLLVGNVIVEKEETGEKKSKEKKEIKPKRKTRRYSKPGVGKEVIYIEEKTPPKQEPTPPTKKPSQETTTQKTKEVAESNILLTTLFFLSFLIPPASGGIAASTIYILPTYLKTAAFLTTLSLTLKITLIAAAVVIPLVVIACFWAAFRIIVKPGEKNRRTA